MFKGVIIIVVLLTGCGWATAQKSEPALGRIHYEFIHINDTLQPEKAHQEEFVAYLGQRSHLYRSYLGQRVQQQVRKQMEDPGFDGNLTIRSPRDTPESYYTDLDNRQFTLLHSVAGQRYIVPEEYPDIEWTIGQETKEIGGYLAQQATGHFGGREYTAWFTTELPFIGAPWKLLGLPGLVLEAYDSRMEVEFRYAGFEQPEEGEAVIELPENGVETDRKSLDRLVEAYRKNPQAASGARAQGGGTAGSGGGLFGGVRPGDSPIDPSRIKSISIIRDAEATSSTVNNPLELN